MEQIREIIAEPEVKKFKSSIFGFNKRETIEFIAGLEQNIKTSVFNYERKLAEQANSLTMALREKETLAVKADELDKKVKFLSIDINEQKSNLAAENNALKARIEELAEYETKNEILTTEMIGLKTRCDYCESEREGLLKSIKEKEDTILEQCKKNAESERLLKTEIEKIKAHYESVRKIQQLNLQTAKEGLLKIINIVEQM